MNINYTETFNDVASRMGPTDLALYAGAGLILYVLFQERLGPIQNYFKGLLNKFNLWRHKSTDVASKSTTNAIKVNDCSFQDLIASWKQTRDLAVASGCGEAVKVIDQVFPYLSPNSCKEETKTS